MALDKKNNICYIPSRRKGREMKIEKMDKKTVNAIAAELEILLSKFAADRGLEYKRAGGRFDATSFKPKVEFLLAGGNEKRTNLNAELYQYKVRFGDKIKAGGKVFTVVEVSDRGKLVASDDQGKRYKFPKPENILPMPATTPVLASAPAKALAGVSVSVRDTVKDTKAFGVLKSTWCKCAESKFLCYPEDGACSCNTYKHHVHCECGGISQVG